MGATFNSLLSIFQSAVPVLVIRMIFTHQRRSTMKSTTCSSLNWRLLARAARTCFSSASHYLGLRINPSCSEICKRRRIIFLNSGTDKFLGRLGKIEGLFISNPCAIAAYILSNLGFFSYSMRQILYETRTKLTRFLGRPRGRWAG